MCLFVLSRKAMKIMMTTLDWSVMKVECNPMKLLCSLSLKVFHVLHKKISMHYRYKYLISNGV